jgi:murein DD-endopeptidase MepM/ murein hydrolase activator NlpD
MPGRERLHSAYGPSAEGRMNLILVARRRGPARHFHLDSPLVLGVLAVVLFGMFGAFFAIGMHLGERSGARLASASPSQWAQRLAEQRREIDALKVRFQERVDALAARMGQVNAQVLRIDALGKRLAQMADISSREFNFDAPVAVGGPEQEGIAPQIPDITLMLSGLEEKLSLRDAQLSALERLMLARKLNEDIRPDGRPVREGFISSYFGERQDPFSGHQAFHRGVDFAGSSGAEVVAVAAGVVTISGDKQGYGRMVEVSHGNGLITRYAHNDQNIAVVGQTVARGDVLASMGSTGRSTGPHVHFEVLRSGQQINPLSFIGK